MNTISSARVGSSSLSEISERYHQRNWKYDPVLWDVLAQVIDHGNPELMSHSVRVANLGAKIARMLDLTASQVELIIKASLFHDIGKLSISNTILSKPGPLTSKEYDCIKSHPAQSVALLQECPDSYSLLPVVLQHHEHFNGEGYPDRISGHNIEIEARVLSVADAIDAMSSDRPYRRALSPQQIVSELKKCAGTQFDPWVAEKALQVLTEM